MATGYADLLRAPHAMRLLAGTLVGRLPNATAALGIVLLTRSQGGDFALAGALSAVYGIANAVGQPLLGRAVDRLGQPRVMLPAALASAAGMAVFALAGLRPLPLAYAAMLVAGFFTPPLEGGLRALWPGVLERPDRVHAAYALDAAAQEVMFAVGPLLVTLLVAGFSEAAALLWIAAVGVAGAVSVVASPPSRAWRSQPRVPDWLGPLRSRGIVVLVASFFFVGLALGSIAVAAVAYADDHGGGMVSSYVLSGTGFGALVGGVAYGARQWPGVHERRLRLLMAGLAVCYLPLALVPGVALMTALAALSGLFLAPTLACAFVVVDRHAPAGTVTEAFSWIVTAVGVGAAVGTAASGPAAQYGGAVAAFAVAGAGGVAALAALLAGGRPLHLPNPASGTEKDRIAAAQDGLRSTHQA
ncbi:MFS transporter [Streptomyces sp. MI02-7b]|uniref:MFS transporter n=1 Tax=Streptomyces sp. MI02-7b TaxID=462941 RepID=UPI0029BE0592|nr:MFS transporter [Streptomyces sp. MI02-7b]MDX3075139.1 MFS transporter [Streptomyces sp. MI02-7b]